MQIGEDTDANAADALAGLVITGREPRLTMVYGLDDSQYATFLCAHSTGEKHKINFKHGTVAGRFMTFTAYGQVAGVELQDDVGIRTVSVTYNLAKQDDDQELELIFH